MTGLGQTEKNSVRAYVFCSSLNDGHQDHSLVPIGRLVDHRSGSSALKKLKILRMNQAHRSGDRKLQRIDHPQRYERLEKAQRRVDLCRKCDF